MSASSRSRRLSLLLIGFFVLVADQWTKWWVERSLELHDRLEVIPGFLNLTHIENPGVAFGMFARDQNSWTPLILTGFGFVALVVVGIYYFRVEIEETFVLSALSLILGGAVGNLIDRVLNGSVTDFIDAYYKSYHWHTFNVADSAITIGVILILLDSFRHRESPTDSATDSATNSDKPAKETPKQTPKQTDAG